MNPLKLRKIIQDIGFTENESSIYLGLLELGSAKISEIAKKSGVKRTSCYVILDSLAAKGLVSKTEVRGKITYIAEPPAQLLKLAEERRKAISETLPEFLSLFNLSETKPKIRFYEGKEGYISICNDSLTRSGDEILFISNLDNLLLTIGSEYDEKHYIPNRVKAGKSFRMLVPENETTKKYRDADERYLRQTKFFTGAPFEATMLIYGNTVSILSSERELIGLVIDSKPIASLMKFLFENTWQQSQ